MSDLYTAPKFSNIDFSFRNQDCHKGLRDQSESQIWTEKSYL